ncbi:MAG TPA: glycosyltransferase [Steroidobacteraceae bacterium]|nr:glycosyltransferase [Steroidobacteraceae bacterium]
MAGKIVLSNVGSLGDLHPLISMALRLKQRGYDAVIATSPDFRANVVSEGLAFHPVGPSRNDILRDQKIDAREFGRRISKDAMYVLAAASFPYLKVTYDDLLPVLEGASLVLAGSMMYSARFAAEKLGIPYLTIALQPMVFLSALDPPSVSQAPWLVPLLRRLGPAVTRAVYGPGKMLAARRARPLQAFRRAIGLPDTNASPLFEGQFSPYGTLATYSSLLGSIQSDYPPNTTITGFVHYDRSARSGCELTPALQKFIAAGPPPLVFTLGSFAVDFPGDFYRVSLDAARTLRQRAILLIGADKNESVRKEQADDVFVCDYAPFSALFPHALITIHHGGIGTVGQALRAGKPQLIVPVWGDQFDNAARVVRLGVGRQIGRNRYSPSRVARELTTLLGAQDFKARAATVGRDVDLEDGPEVVARIVDDLFRSAGSAARAHR